MVAQQLEGFHNDIVHCAVVAFSIATEPLCRRLWGITLVFNLLL